uniref:HSF-type DNA-binding domain-containing protein n=1 Tax=Chaetoceros debilis TaxID=122233 RepID=A0A7S3QB67_9STRA
MHTTHLLHDHHMTVPLRKDAKRIKQKRIKKLPGLTANGKVRQFVKHTYVDRSNEYNAEKYEADDEKEMEIYCSAYLPKLNGDQKKSSAQVVKRKAFPLKLQYMLTLVEEQGMQRIVSWLPHGRGFIIRDAEKFSLEVMAKYFRQTKLSSFVRQLNIYGFTRIYQGKDKGAYYHEYFLRGKLSLSTSIVRSKVKGNKIRAASSPDDEPDFYAMKSMPPYFSLRRKCASRRPSMTTCSSSTTSNFSSCGNSSCRRPSMTTCSSSTTSNLSSCGNSSCSDGFRYSNSNQKRHSSHPEESDQAIKGILPDPNLCISSGIVPDVSSELRCNDPSYSNFMETLGSKLACLPNNVFSGSTPHRQMPPHTFGPKIPGPMIARGEFHAEEELPKCSMDSPCYPNIAFSASTPVRHLPPQELEHEITGSTKSLGELDVRLPDSLKPHLSSIPEMIESRMATSTSSNIDTEPIFDLAPEMSDLVLDSMTKEINWDLFHAKSMELDDDWSDVSLSDEVLCDGL